MHAGAAARRIRAAPTTSGKTDAKWDVSKPATGPAAKCRSTSRSGTWMSLDVSPDGQRDRVRPARRPLRHADRRRRGARHDHGPQLGHAAALIRPTAREIAFTSDRGGGDNIWVIDRAGSVRARQITKEDFRLLNQADWTPDGNFIVARKHFTSSRSLGVGRNVALPPHRRRLGRADDQGADQAEGHQRAGVLARRPLSLFLRRRDARRTRSNIRKDVNGQIYVIQRLDRETGEIETFVGGPGGAIRPTPSPDGKSLAFIRRVRYKSTLMLMDLASGRITPLTDIARPRHAGNLGGPRRLSGDELDARQSLDRLLGRGRDPARRRRQPSGHRHPLPRHRHALRRGTRCASKRTSRPTAST